MLYSRGFRILRAELIISTETRSIKQPRKPGNKPCVSVNAAAATEHGSSTRDICGFAWLEIDINEDTSNRAVWYARILMIFWCLGLESSQGIRNGA